MLFQSLFISLFGLGNMPSISIFFFETGRRLHFLVTTEKTQTQQENKAQKFLRLPLKITNDPPDRRRPINSIVCYLSSLFLQQYCLFPFRRGLIQLHLPSAGGEKPSIASDERKKCRTICSLAIFISIGRKCGTEEEKAQTSHSLFSLR